MFTPPKFTVDADSAEEVKTIVYNQDSLSEIHQFYTELNDFENGFPQVPACYTDWKAAFQKLVSIELSKLL